MPKKKKVSVQDGAKFICSSAVGLALKFFYEEMIKISNHLEIEQNEDNINNAKTEFLIFNLWAVRKALMPERVDFMDRLHDVFLEYFDGNNIDEFKKLILNRYVIYDDAWDDKSGGNQSTLCLKVLSLLFFNGEIKESLLDFHNCMFPINSHLFGVMEVVLDLRSRIEIKE